MFAEIVEPHICRAGRSDAAAHFGASGARRPLRHRSGAAVFDVVAGGFEAFARAGKRGLDSSAEAWKGAFVEIGRCTDAAGASVDRGIPEILGRKL